MPEGRASTGSEPRRLAVAEALSAIARERWPQTFGGGWTPESHRDSPGVDPFWLALADAVVGVERDHDERAEDTLIAKLDDALARADGAIAELRALVAHLDLTEGRDDG